MLYAELDAFEPVAIQEHERGDGWRIFFRAASNRDAAGATLASEFGNALLRIDAIEVDDEDWARRSQAALTAIRVGRIVVAPPWNSDPGSRTPDADVITIVIDPSTGFGTGHHASTRLCLELLQKHDLSGLNVIDVGTGSGVLALAAWRLGADHVTAIDNDPDALDNARDNVRRNGAENAVTIPPHMPRQCTPEASPRNSMASRKPSIRSPSSRSRARGARAGTGRTPCRWRGPAGGLSA